MTDIDRAAEYRRYADDMAADADLLAPGDQRTIQTLTGAARLLRARADALDPTTPETPR